MTRKNINLCFPELDVAARRRLAADSLCQTGQLLCETGILFHWPERRWRSLLVAEQGAELIDAARNQGRSVVLLVPHFGNWEFLSLYLGRYGVVALYDPPRSRAVGRAVLRARARTGARLLPIDAGGLRRFYQILRDGAVAAVLPDQVPGPEGGVEAPFFGHGALTMTFANRVAARTGALLLLGSAKRVPGGFAVRFSEPPADIYHADAVMSAGAMNRAIETLVREDPAQYQWEYKRFKRTGAGASYPRH